MQQKSLLAALLVLTAFPALAQQPEAAPRFGVALSGGGARGFAHIGVLEVLEEAGYRPEVVTGTSMGAVVGGLYAAGWGPSAIDSIAQAVDWDAAFSDAPDRRDQLLPRRLEEPPAAVRVPLRGGVSLPVGLLSGQRVGALLARLTWSARGVRDFAELPVAFAAVATDFETGEAVRMAGGSPLARAMHASLAIPLVFAPVEAEGRLLVDGGLARSLPAEDARALGADVLLCIDISEGAKSAGDLNTLGDIAGQAITLAIGYGSEAQKRPCDVFVRPDLGGASSTAFGDAKPLIAQGRAAMEEALPRLSAALAPSSRPDDPNRTPSGIDSAARICRVDLDGLREVPERRVRRRLRLGRALERPRTVGSGEIAAWVDALYGTGAFDWVRYRIETDSETGGCVRVVIEVEERAGGRLGVALRVDSERRVAALASVTTPGRTVGLGWLGLGASTVDAQVRIGRDVMARATLSGPLGAASGLVASASLAYEERPAFLRARSAAPLSVRSEALRFSTRLLRVRFGRVGVGAGLEAERYGTNTRPLNLSDEARREAEPGQFASVTATLTYDALDRTPLPRSGVRVLALAQRAALGAGFGHYAMRAEAYHPLRLGTREFVALARITLGRGAGDVPPHYAFAGGGIGLAPPGDLRQVGFAGFGAESLAGTAVQLAGVGVRAQVLGQRTLTLLADAGAVLPSWTWPLPTEDYRIGWSATLTQTTPLGPLEAGIAARETGRIRAHASLGYRF